MSDLVPDSNIFNLNVSVKDASGGAARYDSESGISSQRAVIGNTGLGVDWTGSIHRMSMTGGSGAFAGFDELRSALGTPNATFTKAQLATMFREATLAHAATVGASDHVDQFYARQAAARINKYSEATNATLGVKANFPQHSITGGGGKGPADLLNVFDGASNKSPNNTNFGRKVDITHDPYRPINLPGKAGGATWLEREHPRAFNLSTHGSAIDPDIGAHSVSRAPFTSGGVSQAGWNKTSGFDTTGLHEEWNARSAQVRAQAFTNREQNLLRGTRTPGSQLGQGSNQLFGYSREMKDSLTKLLSGRVPENSAIGILSKAMKPMRGGGIGGGASGGGTSGGGGGLFGASGNSAIGQARHMAMWNVIAPVAMGAGYALTRALGHGDALSQPAFEMLGVGTANRGTRRALKYQAIANAGPYDTPKQSLHAYYEIAGNLGLNENDVNYLSDLNKLQRHTKALSLYAGKKSQEKTAFEVSRGAVGLYQFSKPGSRYRATGDKNTDLKANYDMLSGGIAALAKESPLKMQQMMTFAAKTMAPILEAGGDPVDVMGMAGSLINANIDPARLATGYQKMYSGGWDVLAKGEAVKEGIHKIYGKYKDPEGKDWPEVAHDVRMLLFNSKKNSWGENKKGFGSPTAARAWGLRSKYRDVIKKGGMPLAKSLHDWGKITRWLEEGGFLAASTRGGLMGMLPQSMLEMANAHSAISPEEVYGEGQKFYRGSQNTSELDKPDLVGATETTADARRRRVTHHAEQYYQRAAEIFGEPALASVEKFFMTRADTRGYVQAVNEGNTDQISENAERSWFHASRGWGTGLSTDTNGGGMQRQMMGARIMGRERTFSDYSSSPFAGLAGGKEKGLIYGAGTAMSNRYKYGAPVSDSLSTAASWGGMGVLLAGAYKLAQLPFKALSYAEGLITSPMTKALTPLLGKEAAGTMAEVAITGGEILAGPGGWAGVGAKALKYGRPLLKWGGRAAMAALAYKEGSQLWNTNSYTPEGLQGRGREAEQRYLDDKQIEKYNAENPSTWSTVGQQERLGRIHQYEEDMHHITRNMPSAEGMEDKRKGLASGAISANPPPIVNVFVSGVPNAQVRTETISSANSPVGKTAPHEDLSKFGRDWNLNPQEISPLWGGGSSGVPATTPAEAISPIGRGRSLNSNR